MIPVCFHQRWSLLTARCRACLFSSSVPCITIEISSMHPPPVPFMMIPHFSKFDLLLLFILPNYLLVILSSIFSAFFLLSAPCPVAGGSRLGPSSVSGKVTLQLAARSIRGRSLPGRATLTSVPPLSLVQRYAPAGSQMLDWRWKVGGHMISLFLTF